MAKDDDLAPIPSISARRDADTRGAAVPRPRGGSRNGNGKGGSGSDGGKRARGPLGTLTLIAALLVAIGACAWSWQLQESLTQTGHLLERYERRIADLEDRLADTDEGMNENATVQAAKIRELDTEVRKLWDNVWKRSKARLDQLEANEKRVSGVVAANDKAINATQADLGKAQTAISRLQKVSGDLERMMASSRGSQAEIERLADALNAANLEMTKLNKRVAGNEEWIRAINAFRQSTNASISQLQAQLRTLQSAPGV